MSPQRSATCLGNSRGPAGANQWAGREGTIVGYEDADGAQR